MTPLLRVPTRRPRSVMAALVLFIAALSVAEAQYARHPLFTRADRSVKGGSALLGTARKLALDLDVAAFRSVAGPTLRVGAMPLAEGIAVDLDLHEFSILAGDAVITATGPNGPVAITPSVRLYRGSVPGDPASSAYLAISDHGVVGSVRSGGQEYEIVTDHAAKERPTALAAYAYRVADVPGARIGCGLNDHDPSLIGEGFLMKDRLLQSTLSEDGVVAADDILYSVRGAFDADYEFYQLFGRDTVKAIDYMVSTIGRMSEIFERDVKTQVVIGYMNVWTTSSDPYTAFPVMQNALFEARDYWKADKPHQKIERAFTHVFSSKGWTSVLGIAFLNVLCINDASYSFSLQTKDNPRQDLFVLCHELGHNFGSKHTHDCSWNPEIDRCAAAEGGSCFSPAQVKQSQGTIMSYCSQTDLKFHPQCADTIKKYLALPSACVTLSRKLSVRSPQIDLPHVKLNTPVDTTLVGFLYNASRSPVVINDILVNGESMDKVTVLTKENLPITLQPGSSHDLKLRYLSTEEVTSLGNLTLIHDAQNPKVVVAFQAYSFDASPLLSLDADVKGEVRWDERRVGDRADTVIQGLYVNRGKSQLNVSKAEIVGRDRFEFQLVRGTGPFSLVANGGRQSATLRFAPLTPGAKEAWLRVESDSRDGVDSIRLVASARQGPLLQLKTGNLTVDFGKRNKETSYDTVFTDFFYNAGSDTLEVQPIITGPSGEDFTVNLGLVSLQPGSGLDLPITFFTMDDGYKAAYMIVYTNTPRQVDTVFLIAQVGNVGQAAVPVENRSVARLSIAPNPTAGGAEALIVPAEGEAGRTFTLRITDPLGRELARIEGTLWQGQNRITLPLDGLASGRYGVTIATPNGERTTTVTVVR